MPRMSEELIPTRATLLLRLKDLHDETSWQQFFDTYWKLIYGVARQAGLNDVESQDVVQETMLAAAKHLPGFKYDPAIGSFKAWLLKTTRWRIADQLRKRVPLSPGFTASTGSATTTGTEFLKRVPDPAGAALDGVWDSEWQINLLESAMANVQRRIDPQKYQIFDSYVNKGWPPEKVAETFNVPISQVYLAKHRITELIRDEVSRLEKEMA